MPGTTSCVGWARTPGQGGLWDACDAVTACETGRQKVAREKNPSAWTKSKRCNVRSSLFPQCCLALCGGWEVWTHPVYLSSTTTVLGSVAAVQTQLARPWKRCPSTMGASLERLGRSCCWRRVLMAATCCGTARASRGSTASVCCEYGWRRAGRAAADPNLGICMVGESNAVRLSALWAQMGGWGAMDSSALCLLIAAPPALAGEGSESIAPVRFHFRVLLVRVHPIIHQAWIKLPLKNEVYWWATD